MEAFVSGAGKHVEQLIVDRAGERKQGSVVDAVGGEKLNAEPLVGVSGKQADNVVVSESSCKKIKKKRKKVARQR